MELFLLYASFQARTHRVRTSRRVLGTIEIDSDSRWLAQLPIVAENHHFCDRAQPIRDLGQGGRPGWRGVKVPPGGGGGPEATLERPFSTSFVS